MNKRIKELNTKATKWALDNYPPPVNTFEWEDLRNNKFAELIVAECIETLRLVPYNSDREFGDEAIYQEAITEHFGVDK